MFITTMNSDSKASLIFKKSLVIFLVGVILLTSVLSVAALNRTAVINVDGRQITQSTITSNADTILAEAGVKLGDFDIVTTSEDDGVVTVNVARAFEVYVNNNGKTDKYLMADGTVEDLIKKADIAVTEKHIVMPHKSTKLTADMVVTVNQTKSISISVDGKKINVIVPSGTVKNALDYLEITLSKNDKINCKLTDEITDNMSIVITRVAYKNVTSVEKVPFEVIETYTDKLPEGKTKVEVKGVDGQSKTVTKQTLVNGVVKSEELVSTTITKEPVAQEVLIGTKVEAPAKPVASTKNNNVIYDEAGNEIVYTSVLHGSGTAYCAEPGALTASGKEVFVGGVAVNPNIIPLGTKLYIVADDGYVYGYATAVDTGGALMDGSALVDLFYFSYDQCIEFGRRDVSVYILD